MGVLNGPWSCCRCIADCLKFLKEIPSATTNDASANPFQHSSSVMNLYLETSSTLLKVLGWPCSVSVRSLICSSCSVSVRSLICSFDVRGVIKKYDSPEQILEEFFHLRLEFYVKRKVSFDLGPPFFLFGN
ncbi:uncharacterized protein LOC131218465 isoform X1 [Magnolia sinica]|uniref:uncharacterized protein LOC131218465 isoform X1 n=1 Tax=Magnolia sinica TaxID=86752 RepID=UPI0026598043|nr:uncharacterized protein LOC131218465 isoform X1 [Magnolia sinica]